MERTFRVVQGLILAFLLVHDWIPLGPLRRTCKGAPAVSVIIALTRSTKERRNGRMAEIDARTRLVGIIGDPVAHSLSPQMHNAAFAALEMNWRYLPFRVTPGALQGALRGVGALGFVGVNITVPHKEAAAALVDEVDPIAQRIGAVNTVRVADGRLQGFNTDSAGVLDALVGDGRTAIAGKHCIVIGAGGGGRATAFGLATAGAARVVILNRTASRARGLAEMVAQVAPRCHVEAGDLSPASLERALEGADVLVQATTATMSAALGGGGGRADWLPTLAGRVRAGMIVLDIVYTPVWTDLLSAARAVGAIPVSGLAMLVCQGARSFELWTGRPAPIDVMRRAVGL